MGLSCLLWVHVVIYLATAIQMLEPEQFSAVLSTPGQIPEEPEGRRACPVGDPCLPHHRLQLASSGHPYVALDLSVQVT